MEKGKGQNRVKQSESMRTEVAAADKMIDS